MPERFGGFLEWINKGEHFAHFDENGTNTLSLPELEQAVGLWLDLTTGRTLRKTQAEDAADIGARTMSRLPQTRCACLSNVWR